MVGKNTFREHLENNPALEELLSQAGNMDFVFTKEDLTDIRVMLLVNKVPALARASAPAGHGGPDTIIA